MLPKSASAFRKTPTPYFHTFTRRGLWQARSFLRRPPLSQSARHWTALVTVALVSGVLAAALTIGLNVARNQAPLPPALNSRQLAQRTGLVRDKKKFEERMAVPRKRTGETLELSPPYVPLDSISFSTRAVTIRLR